MAEVLDFQGDELHVKIRVGGSAPITFTDFKDDNGNPITTITAARMKFYTGTTAGATSNTLIVDLTMTVTAGSSVSGTLTPTQTRLFSTASYGPGDDFCYGFEIDTADGRTYPICAGMVDVAKELPA